MLWKKLDYSSYAPGGFGTCDCLFVQGKNLWVIDYKYGKGLPVYAENNPQLLLYALGAYEECKIFYQIKKVGMVIVQPRLDNVREFSLTARQLLKWGESIKSVAQLAYTGQGDFRTGEHCNFCRAGATCRFRAERYLQLADKMPADGSIAGTLSNMEVSEALHIAVGIRNWVDRLKGHVLENLLQGRELSGWKVVEGRAGTRKFSDVEAAFQKLKEFGVDELLLYHRQPLSVVQVEKLVPKEVFARLLTEYVIREQGNPVLAESGDLRPDAGKRDVKSMFA